MCGSSNEQHSLLRIHGALTAVAILFSSNYIISKLAMNAFSPMSFAYLRVVGAAIVLSALTAREPSPRLRGEGRVRGDLGRITLYSILGVALNQSLFRHIAIRNLRPHEFDILQVRPSIGARVLLELAAMAIAERQLL